MNIALVLLASGNSRRFQGNKLLHKLNGKYMYRYLADEISACSESLFIQKILVTQYAPIAEDLESRGYHVIWNRNSTLGISHSIHLALDCMETDSEIDAACFAVCDQPYLKGVTLTAFLNQWKLSGKGLGCISSGQTLGNPAVFSRSYFPKLRELQGDAGGKQIIRRYIDDLMLFETDSEELKDIDERES